MLYSRTTAIAALEMEMPEGKQRPPNALHEAAIWYLRSMAKQLSLSERNEFASWLRDSPENVSSFFLVRTVVRRVVPRRRSTSRLKKALTRVLRLDRAGTVAYSRHRTLSLSYYKHVQQQSLYPKIGLLAVAVCGGASWMFLHDARSLKIAAVAFVCFGLLMLREAVIGFRVANGYFGNTESEVRDFVKFIMAHRSDIDFTDQGGKRRPSLIPEPNAVTPTAPSGGVMSK